MFEKRVFLAAGGALSVFEKRGGRLVRPSVFRADEEGLTRFTAYLEKAPLPPVYVLVDFVEEDFRPDTIPHVFGADRRALVANKQRRLFRDTTYTHAVFAGREPGGRRDDLVLFTALIRPDLLGPWLGPIARRKVPLAGIYSLPIISQTLLKKIPDVSAQALLVSLHGNGGLRQTFFRQQQLKVSRLSVVPRLEKARYASYILGEVEKVRRYLGSLRLLTREDPLDVYLLTEAKVLRDLRKQASDSVIARYHFVDIAEMAGYLGVKGDLPTVHADGLFAQALVRFTPPNHYANPPETRYFQYHRAKLGMRAVGIALLAGSVLIGGVQFLDGVVLRQEAAALNRQSGFYEERHRLAIAELPPAPADGVNLKTAVETAEKLKALKTTPRRMMVVLSAALGRYRGLTVDEIEWIASTDPATRIEGGGAVDESDKRKAKRSWEDQPESVTLYQLALVRGRVEPFDGDYRAAMEMVEGFADTLSRFEAVEDVQLIDLPLNLSSEKKLEGSADVDTRLGTADFEIRVAVRVKEIPVGQKTG